ncbi:MAG TPA: galactokinase [Pseudobdellovibrionaceae bacterium]
MKNITAQAHGRVNLIGEHTDYNGGWVLPTTIPQKTLVSLWRREDRRVSASSSNLEEGGGREIYYSLGEEAPTKTWIDYIQGVTRILDQEGMKISGFKLQVDSTVPVGSGLSSSAALEVSFLKALREAFSLNLSDIEIAKIGQRAENEFVGARVGIMDQMACCLAKEGEALFLDTKTLAYQHIPLCLDKMDLLVINSGVMHDHAGGDYNQRRSECEEACGRLKIHELRELTLADLPKLEELPPVLQRRARHVITENQRVHSAVQALLKGEVVRLGELFYESHLSMAQDYEVSIPEIDTLVRLCREHGDVYGARLTGGGFGGSIVGLTRPGTSKTVGSFVARQYHELTGLQAKVLVSS